MEQVLKKPTLEDLVSSAVVLDIGGGAASGNRVTIDLNPNASIVHDLNIFPWPIKDSSATNLLMSHILEHLDNPLKAMEEAHRIAKPGAILEVRIPWWKSDMFSNPAHIHWFKPAWFRRLHPRDNAWAGQMYGWYSGNWKVIREWKLRGKRRFWKIYGYHVWLQCIKDARTTPSDVVEVIK